MAERLSELAELAFRNLIASDDVQLIHDDGELHIAGDDWTLVLSGDPVSDVLIALESEDGTPETALRGAINDAALAAMRDLNAQMQGELVPLLANSPDPLARTLSEVLEG